MNQGQRKNPFWSLMGPLLAYLGIQWAVQTVIGLVISFPYAVQGYGDILRSGETLSIQEIMEANMKALEPAFEIIARYQVEIVGATALVTFALTIPLFVKDRKLEKTYREASGFEKCEKAPLWGYGSILIFGMAGCVAATCLVTMAQLAFYDPQYAQSAEVMYAAGLPVQLLALGVVVPVAEEMMFRGVLFKRFRERQGFWYSAVCSSIFFGFMHTNVTQTVYTFLLGLILAYLYEKFDSLKAPVFLHILMNAGSVILTDTGAFRWLGADPVRMAGAAIGGAFICSVMFVTLQRMPGKEIVRRTDEK